MPTAVSAAPGGANGFAQRLFSPLPERYDRLAEVLSFGQNGRWRRAMVDHVVGTSPELVLDVATGPAGVALQVAARTGARVVGVDVTEAMLRRARDNVAAAGARIELALGRGEQLPFADGAFDAVTFTYLLRYVDDPAATIRRAHPGGEARRRGGQPGVQRPVRPRSGASGGWATPGPSCPWPAG